MLRTLLAGAALGFIGKKLYDEGKLDPYIAKAKGKLGDIAPDAVRAKAPDEAEDPASAQPVVAF